MATVNHQVGGSSPSQGAISNLQFPPESDPPVGTMGSISPSLASIYYEVPLRVENSQLLLEVNKPDSLLLKATFLHPRQFQ
jgi:hypothetical protein